MTALAAERRDGRLPGRGGIPVSVVVMTKDEELNLAKCLRSVAGFGEVFVVDSHSTDRTVEIAEAHGARVAEFTWNGGYPKKKQWALESLPFSYDWVLYVDADEEVTAELAAEIAATLEAPRQAGYFVFLDYRFLGRLLRHGHRMRKLVLFERRKGRFEPKDDLAAANMWEVEGHYQPRVDGAVGTLRAPLVHDDHATLYHFFERHNRYSEWEATVSRPDGRHYLDARVLLKSVFEAVPFRAVTFFLYSFVWRRGFLDGRPGFHYAVAKAFYYWQVGVKRREQGLVTR
jgi:glycosyltransferase involved in cell wall biosynthesis